ncbi:MAG: hypothetical protein V4558_14100 [Gemmatimonadota bacterium]
MKLTRVELRTSPIGLARRRLVGEVVFRDSPSQREEIWFDVPDSLGDQLSVTGNPWLACLLPLAVTLKEPLELCLPVDPALREGVDALMQVWKGWYPGVAEPVAIETDLLPAGTPDFTARTGTFFSAGLDSFYTLLRHEPGGGAHHRLQIDDLITIWGFDIPLENPAAFDRLSARNSAIAAALGKELVPIATNLRESSWQRTNWGRLGQASALAAVAYAIESRFQRVLLPSSIPYKSNRPWGTHPLVDPLLSTSRIDLRNDGAVARRMAKAASVAASDLAMRELRVCWMGRSDSNCGRCEKCLRTLTVFEILGLRDRCVSFPRDAWSVAALAGLRLRQDLDRGQMERVRELAIDRERPEIVRAINQSIRRYDTRRSLMKLARTLRLRPPAAQR